MAGYKKGMERNLIILIIVLAFIIIGLMVFGKVLLRMLSPTG